MILKGSENMLKRRELKEKGKNAFLRNYWACVLVAVVISLLVGVPSGVEFETQLNQVGGTQISTTQLTLFGVPIVKNLLFGAAFGSILFLLVSIFLSSVVEVGGCSFYAKNAFQNAEFNELFFGFDKNIYKNIVLVQFVRKVKIFLWSLLLIIPGIIKSYEYYMIPYILADNPNMDQDEVFALSKKMMDGHKMDVFVFELSFFGWSLLAAFTFGILNIFYVNPYIYASKAEIYFELKKEIYETNQNMNESSQSIHTDEI